MSFLKSLIEARVGSDPIFLSFALRSPNEAFRQLLGLTLPSGFALVVLGEEIDMSIPEEAYSTVAPGIAMVSTDEWRMVIGATVESSGDERLRSG